MTQCALWSENWSKTQPASNIVSAMENGSVDMECLENLPEDRQAEVSKAAQRRGLTLEEE
jgi:hypothetical protein